MASGDVSKDMSALEARLEELSLMVTQQSEQIRRQELRGSIQPAVFIPRDRKVPVFSGTLDKTGVNFEEWLDSVKSAFRTWHMSERDQADAVIDYLSGQAKQTVKLLPQHERTDIAKVFESLHRAYGDRMPVGHYLTEFYQRMQKPQESIRAFAYDLQEIAQTILRQDARRLPDPDLALREQFSRGLLDPGIRRQVKMHIRETPDIPFLVLMNNAIIWSEEEEKITAHTKATCASSSESDTGVDSQDLLKELIKQQAEILTLLKEEKANKGQSRKGTFNCYRCGRAGHVKRNCPMNTKQDKLSATNANTGF